MTFRKEVVIIDCGAVSVSANGPGHTDDSVAVGALTESPTPTEAVCHSVRGDMLLQLRPTVSVVDFGCELLYQGVDLFVVAADSAFAEDALDAFAKILPFFRSEKKCCAGSYDGAAKESAKNRQIIHNRRLDKSGLLFFLKLVGDFVGKFFHLVAAEFDAFFLQILNDEVACVFAFFGGEKKTYGSTCDSAANDGHDNV
jgi:hypothetical protein